MGNFRNRPVTMHQAVCDNCGKDCQVPFRPTSGKPIFCNSCFENNRGSYSKRFDSRNREPFPSQPQYKEQFEQLNDKLDKILIMLAPKEIKDQQLEEQTVNTKEKTKVAKKNLNP